MSAPSVIMQMMCELGRNVVLLDGTKALQIVWDRLDPWAEAKCMRLKKVW